MSAVNKKNVFVKYPSNTGALLVGGSGYNIYSKVAINIQEIEDMLKMNQMCVNEKELNESRKVLDSSFNIILGEYRLIDENANPTVKTRYNEILQKIMVLYNDISKKILLCANPNYLVTLSQNIEGFGLTLNDNVSIFDKYNYVNEMVEKNAPKKNTKLEPPNGIDPTIISFIDGLRTVSCVFREFENIVAGEMWKKIFNDQLVNLIQSYNIRQTLSENIRMLLYGPTGSGKGYIVEGIVSEFMKKKIPVAYFRISPDGLRSTFIKKPILVLTALFFVLKQYATANKNQLVILFFDNIHDLIKGYENDVLQALMAHIDEMDDYHNFIFIAATNKPHKLQKKVFVNKHKLFNSKIFIPPPTQDDLRQAINMRIEETGRKLFDVNISEDVNNEPSDDKFILNTLGLAIELKNKNGTFSNVKSFITEAEKSAINRGKTFFDNFNPINYGDTYDHIIVLISKGNIIQRDRNRCGIMITSKTSIIPVAYADSNGSILPKEKLNYKIGQLIKDNKFVYPLFNPNLLEKYPPEGDKNYDRFLLIRREKMVDPTTKETRFKYIPIKIQNQKTDEFLMEEITKEGNIQIIDNIQRVSYLIPDFKKDGIKMEIYPATFSWGNISNSEMDEVKRLVDGIVTYYNGLVQVQGYELFDVIKYIKNDVENNLEILQYIKDNVLFEPSTSTHLLATVDNLKQSIDIDCKEYFKRVEEFVQNFNEIKTKNPTKKQIKNEESQKIVQQLITGLAEMLKQKQQ